MGIENFVGVIPFTRLVKGMGFAWVFHPFLRRFEQNIRKNGDKNRVGDASLYKPAFYNPD